MLNFLRRTKIEPQLAVAALAPFAIAAEVRQRFGAYLATAEDRALYRFNPAYLAAQLGMPRRKSLELMGAAVQTGLVDLNWEVQCPGCTTQVIAFENLAGAQSDYTCGMCQHHFHAHLDDEVHITFTINQRLRSLGKNADDAKWRREIDATYQPTNSHELLTTQIFRDMFVNDPLPEGESFQVRWMALMFTDLGGSTALYARKGDPRAYGLVREHFNLLFGTVAEAGGAVVKTIGDAVMAAFPSSVLAVEAALAAQTALERFNQARNLGADEQLLLKVGVHAGPTLAVTLNERLDYFGTNVNAAARVQALAHNSEIVVTRQVLDEPGVRELLPAQLSGETLILRGLDELPFEIFRI